MIDKRKLEILRIKAKTDPFVAEYLRLVVKGEEIRRRVEQEEKDANKEN